MRYVVLLGRIFYAAIFILASVGHFSQPAIRYAESYGVPAAYLLVPLSGLISLVGGLSILFGYKARYGAWLIVIFLVPITLAMHSFWGITDPVEASLQRTMFMKNLSMLGGALLIAYFGSGPMSVDKKK
jgi:putative oxidoreductase